MKSVKYIILVTIILFAIVFLCTLPGRFKANEKANETTKSAETSAEEVGGDVETSGEFNQSESVTTAVAEAEIDNEWALYLVNQKSPLPKDFKVIPKKVWGKFEMDERAADYMIKMIDDAKKDGVNISVVSALRTMEYQQTLLDKEVKKYEANGLSHENAYRMAAEGVAIPGQSEHNAGLSADLLEEGNFTLTEDFDKTPEFKWLSENAAKYGYILRYPKDKKALTGIYYEPWHYRFVGVYHAEKIAESGLTLEEYMDNLGK
ncbi:MAG: M15 family metallopeptidase [Oscillospiraceae bacterium]